MKKLLQVLFLVLAGMVNLHAQSASVVFLQKDSTTDLGYHAVYIEADTASPKYDEIICSAEIIQKTSAYLWTNFPAGAADKKRKQSFPADLPRNWVPLHVYKGAWYVYNPCDGISLSQISLTDSAILHLKQPLEESFGYYLTSVRRSGNRRFELRSRLSVTNDRMRITIIDSQRHVAVFRYYSKEQCEEHLMVDAAMVRRFPIIVNDCRYAKTPEFEFDRIDFKSLLRQ